MLVFLDKDGTLIETASGNTFVQSPEDQKLLPGVAERIAELKAMGATLVVASNQGGVASGHKTLESALDEMIFAMKLAGVEVGMFAHSYEEKGYGEAVFIDMQDQGLQWKVVTSAQKKFRKPNDGMLDFLASRIFDTRQWDRANAVMIGDRPEDQNAAIAAGIAFVDAQNWRDGAGVHA